MVPLIDQLSSEQKIGQMLMVGFKGVNSSFILHAIRKYHIGGVIFYRENIINDEETRSLIKLFQNESMRVNHIPLLIATDEEGGEVERFNRIVNRPFSKANKEWGDIYRDNQFEALKGIDRQAFEETAEVFRDLGFNMNLAPVLDVVTNAKNSVLVAQGRAYSDNMEIVSSLGVRYIEQLQNMHIIATAKHFPGHGATTVDSHYDLSIDKSTQNQIDTQHLVPFREAIAHGWVLVAVVVHAACIYYY